MTDTHRWQWLLLPVVFGVALRIIVWIYWIPERNAWIQSHEGDPGSVAFGEGEIDASTAFITAGPLILSLICCAMGRAPRLVELLLMGLVGALATFIIGALWGRWLESRFGGVVSGYGPAILVTLVLIACYYFGRARTRPTSRLTTG